MGCVPSNCITCPYTTRCNTHYGATDCQFYVLIDTKESWFERLKHIFSKMFN